MERIVFTPPEEMRLAVDLLVFTVHEAKLKILMVRRQYEPFAGKWALPGVFVRGDESLDEAAVRGLREETGLEGLYFEQLYTWGALGRDSRGRTVSVSYMALVPYEQIKDFSAGERSTEAVLAEVEKLISGGDIAFDHAEMIRYARWRLANKVEYTRIAFHLVEEEFTLPQLQGIYEILLGKKLYKANFRKKIAELVEETERSTSGDAHRPSRYYRLREPLDASHNKYESLE